MTQTIPLTDAEYIRALKVTGLVPSEGAAHNEVLERIAKRLEYLERNDAHAN